LLSFAALTFATLAPGQFTLNPLVSVRSSLNYYTLSPNPPSLPAVAADLQRLIEALQGRESHLLAALCVLRVDSPHDALSLSFSINSLLPFSYFTCGLAP
jgi:hypothetical protein